MRVWDLPVRVLCRQHLLGEHRELHAMWATLAFNRKGYANHPETLRWKGRMCALVDRHDAQVAEMERRGYKHASELPLALHGNPDPTSCGKPRRYAVNSLEEQVLNLWGKGCDCDLSRWHKRFGLKVHKLTPSTGGRMP